MNKYDTTLNHVIFPKIRNEKCVILDKFCGRLSFKKVH